MTNQEELHYVITYPEKVVEELKEMKQLTDSTKALVAAAYEAAGEACDYVAKSYDVLKEDGKTYEPPRVQKAAKSMVRLASEDVRALTPDDALAMMEDEDNE